MARTTAVGSGFDVVDLGGMWIGSYEIGQHIEGYHVWVDRIIHIMPTSAPWELAVDALLDFMDRLREGRYPKDIESPDVLMQMCVSAARRQR